MSQLSIQELESNTYQKLCFRARLHGVSVEEEAKQILTQAIDKPLKLGDLALEVFGESNGVELELPEKIPHQALSI